MALTETPAADTGWTAPPFTLIGVDGKWHALDQLKGECGTVVAFICNHCPYVKAIVNRLVRDVRDMREFGVTFIGICSSDAEAYPEDSYENMQALSERCNFDFPYLHDVSQDVARAYGAVCTPDFFGFDKDLKLRYRGRLDRGRQDQPPADAPRDLLDAMRNVVERGVGPDIQFPSVGCSIKWLS